MSHLWTPDTHKYNLHQTNTDTTKEAYLYDKLADGRVRCQLCPRQCVIVPGGVGFCKVRKNFGGVLFAQSYGKAVHVTVERIETEAVHHYRPGGRILSLGNFGCNLERSYCQNWRFSQFEYTAPEQIHEYSVQQVIDMAVADGIDILSWTYNDPAVWFEFVVDTAVEARKRGLKNLFKSAFFLTPAAVERLIDVIDIFAISIKSMDEVYYKTFTKGWLPPVLDATRQVHRSGRHYEISNLVVTGCTNTDLAYDKMISFVLDDLSPSVPLHFTRFHPDYKYMDHAKTPLADVERARQRALEAGLEYAYVGNCFESDGLNTYCPTCGELLILRYGLNTFVKPALDDDGVCRACGHKTTVHAIDPADRKTETPV